MDEEDVERKVKPSHIVLGGPSTDLPRAASDESYLNEHERAKVAKRMEEEGDKARNDETRDRNRDSEGNDNTK